MRVRLAGPARLRRRHGAGAALRHRRTAGVALRPGCAAVGLVGRLLAWATGRDHRPCHAGLVRAGGRCTGRRGPTGGTPWRRRAPGGTGRRHGPAGGTGRRHFPAARTGRRRGRTGRRHRPAARTGRRVDRAGATGPGIDPAGGGTTGWGGSTGRSGGRRRPGGRPGLGGGTGGPRAGGSPGPGIRAGAGAGTGPRAGPDRRGLRAALLRRPGTHFTGARIRPRRTQLTRTRIHRRGPRLTRARVHYRTAASRTGICRRTGLPGAWARDLRTGRRRRPAGGQWDRLLRRVDGRGGGPGPAHRGCRHGTGAVRRPGAPAAVTGPVARLPDRRRDTRRRRGHARPVDHRHRGVRVGAPTGLAQPLRRTLRPVAAALRGAARLDGAGVAGVDGAVRRRLARARLGLGPATAAGLPARGRRPLGDGRIRAGGAVGHPGHLGGVAAERDDRRLLLGGPPATDRAGHGRDRPGGATTRRLVPGGCGGAAGVLARRPAPGPVARRHRGRVGRARGTRRGAVRPGRRSGGPTGRRRWADGPAGGGRRGGGPAGGRCRGGGSAGRGRPGGDDRPVAGGVLTTARGRGHGRSGWTERAGLPGCTGSRRRGSAGPLARRCRRSGQFAGRFTVVARTPGRGVHRVRGPGGLTRRVRRPGRLTRRAGRDRRRGRPRHRACRRGRRLGGALRWPGRLLRSPGRFRRAARRAVRLVGRLRRALRQEVRRCGLRRAGRLGGPGATGRLRRAGPRAVDRSRTRRTRFAAARRAPGRGRSLSCLRVGLVGRRGLPRCAAGPQLASLLLGGAQVVDPDELLAGHRLLGLAVGSAPAPPTPLGARLAPLLRAVLRSLRTTGSHC